MCVLNPISRASFPVLMLVRSGLLLGAFVVLIGALGGQPKTVLAQDAEETKVETTRMAEPLCSEPTPCPAPDTTQNPEATCYEPHSSPINKDVTLHIYGRHLAKTDGPPRRLIYRDSEMSGPVARTNDEFEVKSACHVVTTLYVEDARRLSEGDSVEFRLQREQPTPEEHQEGAKGTVSDWHHVELTAPQNPTRPLQVESSAKAEEDSPCEAQDPAATSIGDLSGRHHMNTVRLEGVITQTNAETEPDEKEYALRGETGTIRVTTSKSLPEVDTWYSVTGEVAFNPSEGGEYLKEQRRSACE